jgi:hypothetical protein
MKLRANILAVGVAASGLYAGGCAAEAPAPVVPPSPDVIFLDLSKLDVDNKVQQTSDSLNDWLHSNPSRRVVSATGELSSGERPGTFGVQMITKEGANTGQACEALPLASEDMKFSGPEAYDNRHIQEWHDTNPNKTIDTAFSVYTTARLAGHVICFTSQPQ